ncbi:MAG: hypothetical protein ABI822_33570, partial [Bryobacteraceae bacterium]
EQVHGAVEKTNRCERNEHWSPSFKMIFILSCGPNFFRNCSSEGMTRYAPPLSISVDVHFGVVQYEGRNAGGRDLD